MLRRGLLILALAAMPSTALAQGTIEGVVRSAESGLGLGTARVAIPALDVVTFTNPAGAFSMSGVAAGTHTLEVRLIGYAVLTQEVTVSSGGTTNLELSLDVAAFALEELVIVGSRTRPRTVTESMVPVDVIPVGEIARQAETNIDFLLRNVVPSYNVNIQPISDAATITRPANLRGLASDHTLVLINGKRRHRGAVITWLGAGLSDGAQGPDIGSIPGIALRQVEVLRDGASAQYGSDAIAGVLNFQLKNDRSGGSVQVKQGQHFDGDEFVDGAERSWAGHGKAVAVATNFGVPLGDFGFANVSVEYGNQEPTDRAIQRTDAAALVNAGNTAVRTPTAQVWGSPKVTDDLKVWLNTGYNFDDNEQVYAFGNVATKRVDGGFFFRNPNTRGGVFSGDGGETLLIGDVLQAKGLGSADCPVVTITNNVPDPVALQQVFDDPNCFSYQEMFPGGFTPQFGGEVFDASIVGGVKGRTDGGINWDASTSWGRNQADFFIYNTVNAALGPDTPTDFDPGLYNQEEINLNLDLSYQVNEMANVAAGFEQREERFEIGQGQTSPGRSVRMRRRASAPRRTASRLQPAGRRRLDPAATPRSTPTSIWAGPTTPGPWGSRDATRTSPTSGARRPERSPSESRPPTRSRFAPTPTPASAPPRQGSRTPSTCRRSSTSTSATSSIAAPFPPPRRWRRPRAASSWSPRARSA